MDNFKELISFAYDIYNGDVLSIIDIITDGDFVSATQIATLMNSILGVTKIKSTDIYKLLLDNNYIQKTDKNKFSEQLKLGLMPRYTPNENLKPYCKECHTNKYVFYIWDINIIFKIFNIELKNIITESQAETFYETLNNYCHLEDVNINKIHLNFLMLQTLLFIYI